MNLPQPVYVRTARFRSGTRSKRVYDGVQEVIRLPELDLSCYRIASGGYYWVTLMGDQPTEEMLAEIDPLLAQGQPAAAPEEMVAWMILRRQERLREGNPWTEGHYRVPPELRPLLNLDEEDEEES
jgi:hypothetical protein